MSRDPDFGCSKVSCYQHSRTGNERGDDRNIFYVKNFYGDQVFLNVPISIYMNDKGMEHGVEKKKKRKRLYDADKTYACENHQKKKKRCPEDCLERRNLEEFISQTR